MTPKLKAGFILSIIAHILSWCPILYWGYAYCYVNHVFDDVPVNSTAHFEYSYVYYGSILAIALAIVSLVLIGGRSVDPKARPFKIWGKILSISGIVMVASTGLIIVFFVLYLLAML